MTLDSKRSDRVPPPPPNYAPGAWEARFRHRQVEMSRVRTETVTRDGPPTLQIDPRSNRRHYATNVHRCQSDILPQWVAGESRSSSSTFHRHKYS